VAIGSFALGLNGGGSYNMAIGTDALYHNTANSNVAIGFRALFSNTTGRFLTGIGAQALYSNGNGRSNTAVGSQALYTNSDGNRNTATGDQALFSNDNGNNNTATGFQALYTNTMHGDDNTADGSQALYSNTIGYSNTATGAATLASNLEGNGNTANGAFALALNTHGVSNTANGFEALRNNSIGGANTAIGVQALRNNDIGSQNAAFGAGALQSNLGTGSTAIGYQALLHNSDGGDNVALGSGAGSNVTHGNNVICIGFNVAGADVGNSCYVGNIWQQSGGSQAVYVNSDGKLGAQVSSRRFKDNIKPMEDTSEVIYSLKPVSFRYKPEIEPTRPPSFGLIAEDVEKVNPDLVVRDREGKPYSVRYDQVNAMLLNEFLKEHRTVQELKSNAAKQDATIARQQKQIDALTAGLQKVSAQLEVRKPAPQTVLNSQ
jgi:hypothetical protein